LVTACFLGNPAHSALPDFYGFGAVGNKGAKGGKVHKVYNEQELRESCRAKEPRIIEIMKDIDAGDHGVLVLSNKEIRPGKRGNDYLKIRFTGNLNIRGSDIIIHRLSITNPYKGDGITIRKKESRRIVIYKCNIFNCHDCCIDVTDNGSHVTIAYCKLWDSTKKPHAFGSQLHAGKTEDLYVTMHHNWFGNGLLYRLPRVGSSGEAVARVHLFNNYYSTGVKQGQIVMTNKAEVIAERNWFEKEHNPWLFFHLEDGKFKERDDAGRALSVRLLVIDPYFANTPSWNSSMRQFQEVQHDGADGDDKWKSFLPKRYGGSWFITYRRQYVKPKAVKKHVQKHAGTPMK
jgi:pectate lyase